MPGWFKINFWLLDDVNHHFFARLYFHLQFYMWQRLPSFGYPRITFAGLQNIKTHSKHNVTLAVVSRFIFAVRHWFSLVEGSSGVHSGNNWIPSGSFPPWNGSSLALFRTKQSLMLGLHTSGRNTNFPKLRSTQLMLVINGIWFFDEAWKC